MKKPAVALFILFVGWFFVGCDMDGTYSITAANNSSWEVIFSIANGFGTVALAPGASKTVSLKAGLNVDSRLKNYSPMREVSVNYRQELGRIDFDNRPAYKVAILNYTGNEGTLSAGRWMDAIAFTASASEQTDTSWIIYTSSPHFSAVTAGGYPAPVLNQLAGDAFKVSIGKP
ncbi:MAG: hypothetical protein LBI14_09445 [Treponema sp.]|jgi:hypothetical protein|nr:hypothetical protein [Treponema sp.]